ncbi:phospholipid/cholesterol/gamma-HCH transport system substrate-binding protein [Desulfonatronum thiosulfatophilum]|uniref:Phospholipid/cholesterol/gamma-HCH transport system substrate-binding protein n=1 Tax=Desulfonatronum thiosulfatophilum TaxID=617002 RepID=A0A1G6EIT5_9BACT|nr:MlaD family protein [Desulfonatronum thiosulfatophilum]SDB56865.1 phospholipid/cholesterol/gamma-HCH transport system substrate-binding protein [Desulfonatronum thiosulfatophilum]
MTSGAEIKVGVFVLIACAALAYMTLRVGTGVFLPGDTYEVDVLFENVSGLRTNSPVEIAGIDIGLVETITLDGHQARVTLQLRSHVRLHSDAVATIRTRGVLGDKFVEIQPGGEPFPMVEDGGRITRGATPADMDQMFTKVGDIADDIRVVSRSAANVFGGPQGEQDLRLAFESLRDAAMGLNAMVQANAESVDFIVRNFRDFSADLRDIAGTNKEGIDRIVANLETASGQLQTTLQQAGDVLARLETGEGPLAKMISDPEMGQDLQETMASLESISRKIDEGQGTLGKLINEDTTAQELDRALEGINRFLAKQDQFQTSVDFTSEYLARHGETRSALTLRLQPAEDKYYLLSVVDSPQGRREKKETLTERWVNGERTVIREIEDRYYQSKITFSAQLAKRWDNLVLRGGLIESTGGVGVDYYLWDDRLQLLFEAYDFNKDDNPHLKAGAKLYFLRNFYASLGMDDFARSDRRSFYAGLGFHFTDEDLKYLLTSVPVPNL